MVLKRVIILLFSLTLPTAQAVTFKGAVVGDTVRWENVIPQGSYYVPSQWNIINGLKPTKEWVPGALVAPMSNTLTLTNGGESVDVPFEVVGVEYNTGSAGPTEKDIQTGQICSSSFNGGVVSLVGSACTHNKSLEHGGGGIEYTPYSFLRPIVEFDPYDVAQAFDGKPAGTYRGMVNAGYFYDYFFSLGSDVRVRHEVYRTVALEIEHRQEYVTRITVNGNNEIYAIYDQLNQTVSGATEFQI